MKKSIAALSAIAVLLAGCFFGGCGREEDTITFTAVVEKVYDGGVLVEKAGLPSGDKVAVSFGEGCKKPAALSPGDEVKVTILPDIRETYPLGADGVEIVLLEGKG